MIVIHFFYAAAAQHIFVWRQLLTVKLKIIVCELYIFMFLDALSQRKNAEARWPKAVVTDLLPCWKTAPRSLDEALAPVRSICQQHS